MELFVFWALINFLIGYAIGKPKGQAGISGFVSILLGPIGWLIAAVSPGNTRVCPACGESVRLEALVCRYCHRDLPPPTRTSVEGVAPPQWSAPRKFGAWALVLLLLSVGTALVITSINRNRQLNSYQPVEATPLPYATTVQKRLEFLTLLQPIDVQIPYGRVRLNAGTRLQLIDRSAKDVVLLYEGQTIHVPAESVK